MRRVYRHKAGQIHGTVESYGFYGEWVRRLGKGKGWMVEGWKPTEILIGEKYMKGTETEKC